MQVCSHIIYRTACHQYVVACHMPPILHWTIRHSIPMEQGAFTCSSAYPTSRAYPRHGRVTVWYKEPMQWKVFLPVCTDTIALFALYCQHLFLSFTYLLAALWAGCPPCPESLSLSTDTDSHNLLTLQSTFSDFFSLFLTGCRKVHI